MEKDLKSTVQEETALDLDPFSLYLRDLQAYPPLSREDEMTLYDVLEAAREAKCILEDTCFQPDDNQLIELQQALQEGDKAREMLILSNTRFVIKVAQKWGFDKRLDAIQFGNIGLMVAVDHVDTTYQNRLITYAEARIKRYIKAGLLPDKFGLRVPERVVEAMESITKYLDKNAHIPQLPTVEMIAEAVGLPPEKIDEYLVVNELLSKHFEIDGDDSQDDGDPYRMERISSDGSVEDAATEKILLRQLISIVETPGLLTPRQDEVVNLVFGLKSGIPLTYEEAGEELGITRQAISAILHTALLRLLPVAKAHSLEEYL